MVQCPILLLAPWSRKSLIAEQVYSDVYSSKCVCTFMDSEGVVGLLTTVWYTSNQNRLSREGLLVRFMSNQTNYVSSRPFCHHSCDYSSTTIRDDPLASLYQQNKCTYLCTLLSLVRTSRNFPSEPLILIQIDQEQSRFTIIFYGLILKIVTLLVLISFSTHLSFH